MGTVLDKVARRISKEASVPGVKGDGVEKTEGCLDLAGWHEQWGLYSRCEGSLGNGESSWD